MAAILRLVTRSSLGGAGEAEDGEVEWLELMNC